MEVERATTRGNLRLLVSDADVTSDLTRHLAEQGFPAVLASDNEIDVLFPGERAIFAAAVELDLWCASHSDTAVTVLSDARHRASR